MRESAMGVVVVPRYSPRLSSPVDDILAFQPRHRAATRPGQAISLQGSLLLASRHIAPDRPDSEDWGPVPLPEGSHATESDDLSS